MSRLSLNTNTTANDLVVNTGSAANSKNGDALRTAFTKINSSIARAEANFVELYAQQSSGSGVSISDFGEGFSLNGANKIVTNKLYSTNLTQSTQHYRLELDTNGVVHLPDQSIINGATLKSVAGNYAGITAGPEGHDEDSWMWVDNTGATIATKFSTDEFTWQFDNTGKLTFPGSLTVANGVIGKASTETTVEEDLAGTTTTTDTMESQIEIETTGIVIAKRVIQTVDDGVVSATDTQGSVVELTNSNATIKHYVNPEGPNNSVYRQFTTDGGAIIESVQEDVGSVTFGRVNAAAGIVEITAGDGSTSKGWSFDNDGVLSLPTVLPTGFTAVLDSAHMVDAVAFEGDLWGFEIEFSLTGDGQVETIIGNNVAWPSNPGYVTGYTFEYTEADHGIPNYTFTLELTDVQHPGDFIYTTNLAASNPPRIPNSITSFGATKVHGSNSVIVANGSGIHEERFTFAGRNLILPGNGDIKDYLGNSVLGGGASTGNIGFVTDYIYDFAGVTIENADLEHGATAAVIVPANGNSTNPIHLNNLYGPVRVTSGIEGATQSWNFNSDGSTTFPNGVKFDSSEGNTFALDSTTISSINLRDDGGRGFYTDNGGYTVRGNGTYGWLFGSDGTTTFPSNTIKSVSSLSIETPTSTLIPSTWNGGGGWNQGSYINLATTGGTGTGLTVNVAAGGGGYINISAISIHTPGSGYLAGDVITINNENTISGTFTLVYAPNTWEFDIDGNLTLPVGGDIFDSTGTSVLGGGNLGALQLQTVPSTKYGTTGDTKGMVAIDSTTGDFYYCTTNYTDGLASIWRKVTGSDAW